MPIKSRPIYPGLDWIAAARRHLILAEGEGALAVLDLLQRAETEVLARTLVLYTAGASKPQDHLARLGEIPGSTVQSFPTIPTLLFRLNVELARATMSTRLYVTGTEGFIGQAVALSATHGIDPLSILTEHRGSLARRVQCVHCKGMIEDVTTSTVACTHCGQILFVRDHFSRRLGAFQGVCIDAEVPGDVPLPEVIYP